MTKHPLSNLKVSPEASVEEIVCSLSPMKKSKGFSYFDGVLSEDTTSVRFFGFDSSLHQQLQQFHKERDGVIVEKCEVRNSSKFSPTGIEIMVGRKCHIVRTDSKFDVHRPDSAAMKVADVQKVACFQRLSLIVKAVQIGDVATVGCTSKRKQDVLISDSTGVT